MAHEVEVKISGPGFYVACHVIDQEILDQLLASRNDAIRAGLHPFEEVGNVCLRFIRVASGFDIYTTGDLRCTVRIDGKTTEIEKFGFLEEGEEFEEAFDTPRNKTLFARRETLTAMGEGVALNPGEMFVIETIDMKFAELTSRFSCQDRIDVSALELACVDLDEDTELSEATYGQGLLRTAEKDIRQVICGGVRHDFELEIQNSYPSWFYLVRREEDGTWTQEVLSDLEE